MLELVRLWNRNRPVPLRGAGAKTWRFLMRKLIIATTAFAFLSSTAFVPPTAFVHSTALAQDKQSDDMSKDKMSKKSTKKTKKSSTMKSDEMKK
jgi:hypothetical protein